MQNQISSNFKAQPALSVILLINAIALICIIVLSILSTIMLRNLTTIEKKVDISRSLILENIVKLTTQHEQISREIKQVKDTETGSRYNDDDDKNYEFEDDVLEETSEKLQTSLEIVDQVASLLDWS